MKRLNIVIVSATSIIITLGAAHLLAKQSNSINAHLLEACQRVADDQLSEDVAKTNQPTFGVDNFHFSHSQSICFFTTETLDLPPQYPQDPAYDPASSLSVQMYELYAVALKTDGIVQTPLADGQPLGPVIPVGYCVVNIYARPKADFSISCSNWKPVLSNGGHDNYTAHITLPPTNISLDTYRTIVQQSLSSE